MFRFSDVHAIRENTGDKTFTGCNKKKRNPNFILMLQLSILSVCVRFNCYCVVRGEYETERENDKIEKKKKRKKEETEANEKNEEN